ncbi:MAG TPA: P-II family nitrogen regulator [Nitrososphaera sp.]|nr:P-II family nitrogen regulator [Nitrososphaera sp.]
MKKLEAILRAERMPLGKETLRKIGIGGMTISVVAGWNKQREPHFQCPGQSVRYDLLSLEKFEIMLPDDQVDNVVQTISESVGTGDHGVGVVFVSPIDQAFNIATLDKGDKVIV